MPHSMIFPYSRKISAFVFLAPFTWPCRFGLFVVGWSSMKAFLSR